MARVFIVEDEALIALELQDRLRDLGHTPCGHAARGATALAEIPRADPDLVIMDVNLGAGPSGVEIAARLRAQWSGPFVFITAYDAPTLPPGLEESPVLVKPFLAGALGEVVERALR
jgi:DNA-binding response OmpR family regulator